MKDGQPYALARLWEWWKDRQAGTDLLTLTVIVTEDKRSLRKCRIESR
jgi:hypothetical protein